MTTTHTPTNILVTGAAGFIGSNFVRYLLKTDSDLYIEIELILSRSNFVSIQFHQFFLLLFKGFLEIVLKVK